MISKEIIYVICIYDREIEGDTTNTVRSTPLKAILAV